jgi:hypothetical protein
MDAASHAPDSPEMASGVPCSALLGDLFHDHFAADVEATALDETRSSTARKDSLHRSEIGQLVFVFRRAELSAIIARLDAVAQTETTTSHPSTLIKLLESYESRKT